MTQEEKELLLKDLCARLPYGVKCYGYQLKIDGNDNICIGTVDYIKHDRVCLKDRISVNGGKTYEEMYFIENIKPYLRPMSSMTEEEFDDLKRRYVFCESCRDENDVMDVVNRGKIEFCDVANVLSWLNAHHFDYRGLIPMGLGIDYTDLNIY